MTQGQADPPASTVAGEIAPPSGIVVVRDYVDPQKRDGREEYYRIRYVWDYNRGVALFERYNMEGQLLESVPKPALTLESTEAEMAYAYQLVRNDPELGPKVIRPDAKFQGGFSVRGPEYEGCGPGSRCVRVFVQGGADAEISLVNVIVDLATRRIVGAGG